MNINFFFEDTNIIKLDKKRDLKWIINCIKKYNKEAENINFIFCSDQYLLKINQKYLTHDYYTDTITFDNCVDNKVNGDIFISVDRVGENSRIFNQSFLIELHRVMIHGILHLLGLNDSTNEEKKIMTRAENSCIEYYNIL